MPREGSLRRVSQAQHYPRLMMISVDLGWEFVEAVVDEAKALNVFRCYSGSRSAFQRQ